MMIAGSNLTRGMDVAENFYFSIFYYDSWSNLESKGFKLKSKRLKNFETLYGVNMSHTPIFRTRWRLKSVGWVILGGYQGDEGDEGGKMMTVGEKWFEIENWKWLLQVLSWYINHEIGLKCRLGKLFLDCIFFFECSNVIRLRFYIIKI